MRQRACKRAMRRFITSGGWTHFMLTDYESARTLLEITQETRMKTVQLNHIFTHSELRQAAQIFFEDGGTPKLHARLCELVRPSLNRINDKTGQENDVDYLAYALEFALNQTAGQHG